MLGAVCIITWVSTCSILLFGTLMRLNIFRIPKEIEIVGLDIAEMGGVEPVVYEKIKAHTFVSKTNSVISSNSHILLPG